MNDGPSGGLVAERVLAAFAQADAARMAQLDRLIKAGKDRIPTTDDTTQETTPMPCSVCGGAGHNARGCSKSAGEKPAPKPTPEPKPKVERSPSAKVTKALHLVAVKQASVEQLVETIAACRAELEERQEQLRAQLETVAKAIGTAA